MKKSLLLIMIALVLLVFVSCDQQTEIEKIDCWNCGVSISKEAAFCEYCGVAIKDKENQTDDSTTADTEDKTDNTNDSTDTQEPHTHSYNKEITAPTCTEKGYTTYTCSCGDTYTADEVKAPGHSYSKSVTAPTCTQKGYTTYTCSCGDTYTADEVAPEHQYVDYVCQGCGYTPIPQGYTVISTKEQLSNISLTGKYILMCDIDMGQADWTPIGTEYTPFSGVFDGNGYCIKNIRIAKSWSYSGIFGVNEGTVKNLGVENLTVLNSSTKSGGLVGENSGIVNNCYVSGTVSSSGYISNVGGLVGVNLGEISNCFALCDVSVTATSNSAGFAGGLVGENSGHISNCYASGNIKATSEEYAAYGGGLVGHQDWYTNSEATITKCFATGKVQVTAKKSAWAGGIIGWTNGDIVNCWYADMNFTVKEGYSTSYEPTNIHGAETTASTLKTINFQMQTLGWNTTVWNLVDGQLPTLK